MEKEISLNAQQKKVVENIDGSYLVLAGPGTGKTTTLAARVKYMIEKGIDPEKILCLTFSDAAANEMKKTFDETIGRAAIGIDVFTYHGFCCYLIQNHSDVFEVPDNIGVVSDSMSRAFIEECIEEIKPEAYVTEKGDPYYFIDKILDQIGEIKSHRLTKKEYFDNLKRNVEWEPLLKEKQDEVAEKKGKTSTKTLESNIKNLEKKIAKAKELWDFYEKYQEKLSTNNYMDFNDMISLVLDRFETDAAFLDQAANKYEYILVDEYQDTNTNQNEIVFKLTEALKTQNVTVVGDDDQIIYSFQGAHLDTIENFLKKFPKTQVICLTENHRSTQKILDLAYKIADQDKARLVNNPFFKKYKITKRLTAANKDVKKCKELVHCTKYADPLQEYNAIVDMIVQKSFEGTSFSNIAVLAKTNEELAVFAELLENRAVPYELKNGKPIFSIPAVNVLWDYIQALVNPDLYGDRLLKFILSEPFQIDASDYMELCEEYSKSGNAIKSLKFLVKGAEKRKSPLNDLPKLKKLLEDYEYLQKYRTNCGIKRTIQEILARTKLYAYYLETDVNKIDNIAGIAKLIEEAADYSAVHRSCHLDAFVEYINKTINDGISILTDKAPVKRDAVQLSTYYSAKGREYDIVFMPTLISDKWESAKDYAPQIPLRPDNSSDAEEVKEKRKELKMSDAVKVMYVGMTRARRELYLSFIDTVNNKAKKPTKFIADFLDNENVSFEMAPAYTEESYAEGERKLIEQRPYDYEADFKALTDGYFKNHVFSVSDINSYNACPRQYLYSNVLELSGKDGNPDALSFGSAVHKALEKAVDYARENHVWCAEDELVDYFKKALKHYPTKTKSTRKTLEKRGEKVLRAYYNTLIATEPSMLQEPELKIELNEDFPFTGRIDRIDKNNDGSVTIYDYKTGNTKKEDDISLGGKHSGYYRQMCVYKYVYEKITGKKVRETTFVFVENPDKNVTLNLTDKECSDIWETLKEDIKKMKEGHFEPTYDETVCKYCTLKEFCQRNRV